MSGEKAIAIHRAWEKWPDVDVELVADLVAHGWDARASQPVQVEVTEEGVLAAATELMRDDPEAEKGTYSVDDYLAMARAALSALGGGE